MEKYKYTRIKYKGSFDLVQISSKSAAHSNGKLVLLVIAFIKSLMRAHKIMVQKKNKY